MSIYLDTRCSDCKRETNHHRREKNAEWYMVQKEIWNQATQKKAADFLCIGCLEKRIGRILIPADFSNALVNHPDYDYDRSARLKNRLGIYG